MDIDNTISSKYEVDLQASQSQSCAEEREKRKYVLQQKRNNRGCHPASTSDSVERIPFSNNSSVSTNNVERRNVYHFPTYATPNISSNLFHSSTQVKDNTISSKYEVDLQAIQRQMCAEEREKRKYVLQQKRNNRGCHPASTSDSVKRIPFSNTSSASTNNVERRNVYHLPTYAIPDISSNVCHSSTNEKDSSRKISSRNVHHTPFDSTTIEGLKDMLDSCNPLVQSFRMHQKIAALINGDFDGAFDKRDIVYRKKSGGHQRISELHPSYLALQYPLIFPYAEDGYRVGIKHREIAIDNEFLVDGYTMIESARLNYIRTQQPKLRSQSLKNLNVTVESGENNASSCGKPILLPSSFTGGSRYMMQKYLDAMAICKSVGYPDLFITVTCNPNWPEIYRCLHNKALNAEDRPDIISRLFKSHCSKISVMYTVEFQKRGLPHVHICLFLGAESKFPTASDIDCVISAEIPDKERDPELYMLVKQFMIHGPCGTDNPLCPCMVQQKCSKKFPKKYVDETCVDSEGYPVYRHCQTSNTVVKNGVTLDNRFVVPYNALLLRKYQGHVNVEWCNQSGSIKYLFKYINKGPDRVTASVFHANSTKNDTEQNVAVDEIKAYLDCRYIFACEAAWRIFMYDIHYRYPAVEVLPFHCEDGQSIMYNDDDNFCDIVTDPVVKMTMFTEWMNCNKVDEFSRTLRYVQFPGYYVWNAKNRKWNRRKHPYGSIGRIHYVPSSLGDCYYLRILLNHIKGPTYFEDIKTVDGLVFQTFKDACFARGLLDDDKEYVNAVKEASTWSTGDFLRTFFVMLLLSNSISRPGVFWSETKSLLCEDILYQQRKITDLDLQQEELENICLSEIEKLLLTNGSTVRNFDDMPSIPDNYVSSLNNRLIMKELSYDRLAL
ncbi:uncharacterized protein LOC110900470 [Helianthus annuus]|uniref:uncharacterized protein LOC110900470 n=1 Tax=Helianthus annuus TaxID=4232 RepID=UPI0016532A55|nr:uncharacterized protein LOC110900470 [Helianthus annuus]